jgi:hypothetical protein
MLLLLLEIVLLMALFGGLLAWPHSKDWGISLMLLALLILFRMGRLSPGRKHAEGY